MSSYDIVIHNRMLQTYAHTHTASADLYLRDYTGCMNMFICIMVVTCNTVASRIKRTYVLEN